MKDDPFIWIMMILLTIMVIVSGLDIFYEAGRTAETKRICKISCYPSAVDKASLEDGCLCADKRQLWKGKLDVK